MFDDLTDKNIEMYMMKMYVNSQCIDLNEYHNDMKTFKYIKRLLNRYENTGELKERLILNHLNLICNVFTPPVAARILFFKLDKPFWSDLKTFLIFLSAMPDIIPSINGKTIRSSDIPINFDAANKLREI